MDWATQTDFLRRIVALLLALADLADRAGRASPSVRRRVLDLLRQAEWVAGVEAPARDFGAPQPVLRSASPPLVTPGGDDPVDAASLALRLRALALAWATLLAWMLRINVRAASLPCPSSAQAVTVPTPARPAPTPPDTS